MTFEEFLDAELASLRRYAVLLTGDRHSAHDALADALIQAQRRWPKIAAMDHPAAYVRRTLTNAYLAERRRWASRFIRPTSTGALPDSPAPDGTTTIDDRAQLHTLLCALPRAQRAAIVLRYYLDASDDVIATELGCSAVTVRAHICKGLAALRVRSDDSAAPAGRSQ